jgi:hypothetical protein
VCHDGRVPTFEPVDHTFFDTAPVIVRTSVLGSVAKVDLDLR